MKVAGRTVVHQVAWFNRKAGIAVTQCGQRINLTLANMHPQDLPECSHCPNRRKPTKPRRTR